ncbi:ATP phosphoribosyltransferase regulatory subunit [Alicyclobacillus mali]|uniref:ATP phosphoribosyltransferase regulatory subunit n=1 Tax=Alicyclobacillus mali (ex Roth et al. 2021) TaxID=1123961 RepID=A0ABS0F390_9BACL|nr:ATP phosphoribosyltransferase regulatory subunit [Alicyclobacillus mali (ex Roth et al. 2021)]MBF8377765.1 ATP phosphoribosyltransferase regulatory subunit [Alicyclobacillus mali (ex Roth et al. 2021)]MCL6488734.1 ATP phosphoribosyltransferase regulatory subunit [Alicyclobacillus mali (ex Roth et al. 2021)]
MNDARSAWGARAWGAVRGFADRPPGMQDGYPDFAKRRRAVETRLLSFVEDAGYESVTSGLFEYVDTLLRARSPESSRDWIRLFDGGGHAVALRPEMTPSIARMAAPRVAAGRTPIRWCYCERVYRRTDDPASLSWASGKAAESTQVGIERIGEEASVDVDMDVLRLLHEASAAAGVRRHRIVVSHARLVPRLLEALGISASRARAFLACLTSGNYVQFRELWQTHAAKDRDLLSSLLAWSPAERDAGKRIREASQGELEALLRDAVDPRAAEDVRDAWRYLCRLADALHDSGLASDVVTFDLALHRELDYYTGLVFEMFAPGVGAPIAQGGRYDELLAQFGAGAPAVGFAFEVERVMAVLEAQEEGEAGC